MADLLKFLFKSKFMRKFPNLFSICSINFLLYSIIVSCSKECSLDVNNQVCEHGDCKENYCECHPGWSGKYCQFCSGRVRLWNESGTITDGSGNYSVDNQCTWLIDPNRPDSYVRLYLDHFATECSWDHLYIYDGGSVYDPLLAVFSGMIVQDHYQASRTPEVVAKSGKALLYFYSDAAYNLTGFSISYRVNGCPSSGSGKECSGHGVCIDGECTCSAHWTGEDCTQPLCPSDCHGNGECDMERHRCLCHAGFTGNDCKQRVDFGWWESFPQSSTNPNSDVVRPSPQSYYELERASHSSVVLDDEEVWVIGGYSFAPRAFLLANNLTDGSLQSVESNGQMKPSGRYGHSSITYKGSIYVFGGAIHDGMESNELWMFEPDTRTWTPIDPSSHSRVRRDNGKPSRNSFPDAVSPEEEKRRKDNKLFLNSSRGKSEEDGTLDFLTGSCLHPSGGSSWACTPIGVAGHATVVVEDAMLVIFGHSSVYGALNLVQEYHFSYRRWKVIETDGAVVTGTYGHTAVWDPETARVYVHGGLQSFSSNTQVVSRLIAFDPFRHKWFLKRPAPLPRFLHSATLISGLMFVFGGNTHNDTAFSYGAKCFSADFIVYDIHCDTWHQLDSSPDLGTDTARYGHSAVPAGGKMVVLGGFNGRMLGTTLHYHPGKCDVFTSKNACLVGYPGRKCIWNRVLERCEVLHHQDKTAHDFCALDRRVDAAVNNTTICNSQTSCHSCLYNSYGCVWCNNKCFHEKCADFSDRIVLPEGCEDRRRWWCNSLKSCHLCHAYKSSCNWLNKECLFAPNQTIASSSSSSSSGSSKTNKLASGPDSSVEGELVSPSQPVPTNASSFAVQNSFHTCPVACSQKTTCANCTQGPCMWCFNQQRCVTNNSYLVSFPFGQCREWATEPKRCFHIEKGMSRCTVYQTCKECQEDIGCGWCGDGTDTGTGSCLEGGQSGPVDPVTSKLDINRCDRPHWFFTTCPACNCNGHSHCVNDTVCVQPCANNTQGPHCEKCKDSFFGKPINGGFCKQCQCNDHGVTCKHDTGVCHCHTKGVIGDHCERCDTQNNYFGEPLKGSCFYDLQIDYQFTFNLSKQEDIHIRRINFYNIPSKSDVDTDFDIQCSKPARIKISAKQTGGHETWIVKNFTGMTIKRHFSASEYVFGSAENNTTFHVYVFNFTPPIEIIISFSQHPKLDLIQFFSIFSLCFMVLLLMAFVMWKIKQKYDLYTRRQRLMEEMEAMASRPFRDIFLELQFESPVSSPSSASGGDEKAPPPEPEDSAASPDPPAVATLIEKKAPTVDPPPPPPSKKKGKMSRTTKKGGSNSHQTDGPSPTAEGTGGGIPLVSNGVAQRNVCNGSIASSIHPQISLQAPDTKLVKNKNNPSPISLEPCEGNRAAVLSLLVQLPTGNQRYTSPGHPGGLAVASALVSLGPPRKNSLLENAISDRDSASKGPSSVKTKPTFRLSSTHATERPHHLLYH